MSQLVPKSTVRNILSANKCTYKGKIGEKEYWQIDKWFFPLPLEDSIDIEIVMELCEQAGISMWALDQEL